MLTNLEHANLAVQFSCSIKLLCTLYSIMHNKWCTTPKTMHNAHYAMRNAQCITACYQCIAMQETMHGGLRPPTSIMHTVWCIIPKAHHPQCTKHNAYHTIWKRYMAAFGRPPALCPACNAQCTTHYTQYIMPNCTPLSITFNYLYDASCMFSVFS